MAKSRLQIARADIARYFDELPSHVFRQKDLGSHLALQRSYWRLTESTSLAEFIRFLSSIKLREIRFPFPKPYKAETRFTWGQTPLYEVMLTLKPAAYFSHYTAMRIHGLTEQLPKTTYVNAEQKLASWQSSELSQKSIDVAFRRPVRFSKNIAETKDFRICILSGKNTGQLGVVDQPYYDDVTGATSTVKVTNLERTLIDITVRPAYSGGVAEVLKAFELAQGRVSVNRLSGMLRQLEYIYPYHQAIGFYLERAGYKSTLLDLFRALPMGFDFYLVHGMRETKYDQHWRLYVPKGF